MTMVTMELYNSGERQLPESMYFLPRSQLHIVCGDSLKAPHLLYPAVQQMKANTKLKGLWIGHAAVSEACGYSSKRVRAATLHFGRCLWSTVFESFHGEASQWDYKQCGFTHNSVRYPSTEHFFQSRKLKANLRTDTTLKRLCKMTCDEVWNWGQKGGGIAQKDFVGVTAWNAGRVEAMQSAVALRFSKRGFERKLLNNTGTLPLVSVKGGFWGWPGSNKLAEIYENFRDLM